MTTTVEQIKRFWESRAEADVRDGEVTHRDVWQRWLEVQLIRRHLTPCDRVIDVGCGNGHTTWQIAPLVAEVVGIDYSEGMIRRARESPERPPDAPTNVSFHVGDVLHLSPDRFGCFDVALSERCLINLGSWDEQRQAIRNIAGVLRPEGRFIYVEGCGDGRSRRGSSAGSAAQQRRRCDH